MPQAPDFDDPAALRRLAEQRLQASPLPATHAEADAFRLLHELQVHQVELEMQNESLRQARAETQLALDHYTDLYRHAPVGFLSLDRQCRVQQHNRAAADLLGTPDRGLQGRNLMEFVRTEWRNTLARLLARCFAASARQSAELGMQTEAPASHPREVRVELLAEASGHTVRMALIDVTDARQLADLLNQQRDNLAGLVDLRTRELRLQTERAEAASRAKSTFLTTMSHELRTPMHAIMGFTQLLLTEALTPRQHDFLEKVLAASQHLMALLSQVLDLSRIEADKVVLEQRDFTLASLLASVELQIAGPALEKGLRYSAETGNVPALLHGDVLRLTQMLLNLLSNAIKFSDHGAVKLRCSMQAASAAGLLLRFEVQDNGKGIAADQLQRLWLPFEQADSSNTRSRGGAGLGLAITRGLAQAMGGSVGADSTPGQGSVFWFTAWLLPAMGDTAGA